ncbi:hypothetical protein ACS0TY_010336 [Phlomoides rotata]
MDDEHPDWLPANWQVCVRVRSYGRKDKYYIDPHGNKFNSKPEVLRYLKEAENDLKLKEPNKAVSQGTDAEKLPLGWIKEIKTTKKGGKTRRNPYYVDPVSGHHFRSIQEVNRYLETKDSGKAKSEGDDTNHPTEESKDHSKSSTVVAEEQRFTDSKEDKILAGDESIKSVENSNSLEANAIGQTEEKDSSAGEDQKQENVTTQNKRQRSKRKSMDGLPRRTSKRLARMETDSPLELETSNGATKAASEKTQVHTLENTGKSEINTCGDFGKQKEPISGPLKDISFVEEHEASTIINTTGKSETYISGDFGKQEEVTNVPLRDIDLKEDDKNRKDLDSKEDDKDRKALESKEDDKSRKDLDLKEDDMNIKDLNLSLKDLLMDPCIEFAIKTLTGAIPLEDATKVLDNLTPGSSYAPPSGDIWADPCFEFAVKTLTSEVPTEDAPLYSLSSHQDVPALPNEDFNHKMKG